MAFSSLPVRLRRLLQPQALARADAYTAGDVRRLLDPGAPACADERAAVLEIAALPSVWLGELSSQQALALGRLAQRLPTIIYLYASGASPETISRRVGSWTMWGVERALDAACACMAARLNRQAPRVRGRASAV